MTIGCQLVESLANCPPSAAVSIARLDTLLGTQKSRFLSDEVLFNANSRHHTVAFVLMVRGAVHALRVRSDASQILVIGHSLALARQDICLMPVR